MKPAQTTLVIELNLQTEKLKIYATYCEYSFFSDPGQDGIDLAAGTIAPPTRSISFCDSRGGLSPRTPICQQVSILPL